MTLAQVDALAAFLRDRAAVKSVASQLAEAQQPAREGMALLDVAEAAQRLDAGDPRLDRLATGGRFVDLAGRTIFLGGGDAVYAALREAAAGHLADERQALDRIIAAALSEPPPESED